MGIGTDIRGVLRATPVQAALLAVGYFAFARIGLSFEMQPQGITAIWPVAGLYLGVLLISPRSKWAPFAAAAFAGDLAANLVAGNGLSSLGIAIADISEGLLAATLIYLFAGPGFSLERVRDVVALAVAGAGTANAITATIGAGSIALSLDEPFGHTWLLWWSADAIGILAVAPAVWAVAQAVKSPPTRADLARLALPLAGLVVCAMVVFSTNPGIVDAPSGLPPAVAVPFLLWIAWRCGAAATAIGSLVLCAIAAGFTVNGLGPLAAIAGDATRHVLSLQVFLGVAVVTALAIAAAMAEGKVAQQALTDAERRFRTLVEQIPTATYICDYDEEATIRYISPQAEAMTGYPARMWTEDPDHWTRILHPDDREQVTAAVAECVRNNVPYDGEYRMVCADGKVLTVWDRETIVRDESGRLTSQGILVDVTELRQAERALIDSEELHRAVVDALEEGVFVLDADGLIVAANETGASLLGFSVAEMIGFPLPFERAHLADGSPVGETNSPAMRVLRTREPEQGVELRVTRTEGDERWLRVNYQPISLDQDDDAAGGIVFSFVDVTERRQDEARIAYLAYHDALTGLPNRPSLERALDPALARARRGGHAAALIYFDLDNFKVVNDTLGHAAGDEVLRRVAARLKERLREGDMLTRLSGDEFMLLLPELGGDASEAAWRVAHDMIAQLESPFAIGDSEFEVTASAGIALYPLHGERGDELLKHADAALYETKRNRPGTVGIYENRANQSTGRLTLSSRVRRALARDEFELHFQPVFELSNLDPIGVEALLRWNDPDRGMILPGEFIPLAEETGLIDLIGDWVIDAVLAQGEAWREQGICPLLAFNVSPRQLRRRGFAADLARRVDASTISPVQLSVEITESSTMDDANRSGGVIKELHELGVHLAIDDFGAEFSSLTRLRTLPVDMLKVDRSFLRGVPEDPEATAVVSAIVQLATALEMRAVAEGVETEAQLEFLRSLGCGLGQGFHLARPMPAAQVGELLAGPTAEWRQVTV